MGLFPRTTHLKWIGYWAVFIPLVVGSCSRSASDKKRIERAKEWMVRGDQCMVSADWTEAREAYEQSRQLLTGLATRGQRSPLDAVVDNINRQLGYRLGVFSSPQAAVLCAFRLAADPENEKLLEALWNLDGTAKKALGKEQWGRLSERARGTLISYIEREVSTTLTRNSSLCTSIQVQFGRRDIARNMAVLDGVWKLGTTSGKLEAELHQDGPVWRIVDISSDILGSSFSGLVSNAVDSLERLHPLEEALLQENGEQLLIEAIQMSFDEQTASSDREHKAVRLPVEVPIKVVGGDALLLSRQTMVELMDERRVVDDQTEVKVRLLGASWKSKLGWIPEAALPSADEGTVWGTEEIPLPG